MKKVKLTAILIAVAAMIATNTNVLNAQALKIDNDGSLILKDNAIKIANYKINIGAADPVNGAIRHTVFFGSGIGNWGFSYSPENFYIFKPTTGIALTAPFWIRNNGYVGISLPRTQPAPQYTLDINGTIRANTNLVISDKRFKKDIKLFDKNINNLLKLNSVCYKNDHTVRNDEKELAKYLDTLDETDRQAALVEIEKQKIEADKDTTTHFGFIAQELREVYPNLVFEDNEGYLSVNYIGLIPVLVDAIKELNKKVEFLEGKNKETNFVSADASILYQNNPNPFNEKTEIKYYIPENSNSANIIVYDLTGSQIMKFDLHQKGYSSIFVNGNQLKAGMYIYALLVDGKEIDTKRMILTQ